MSDEINSVELGEDFIAHYGVKGMHWGIRKDPGIGRAREAILDRNDKQRHTLELAAAGKQFRTSVAVGRAMMGSKRMAKNYNKAFSRLDAQDARLRSGKPLKFSDRMDVIMTASLLDLGMFVTHTPDRSADVWNRPNPVTRQGRGVPGVNR